MSEPNGKSEYVVIDDKVIDSGDHSAIIHPVWWKGDIYDSFKKYEASLKTFSKPQRLVFAMMWYDAEVNNGGHEQFFSNSTGIVWKDAMEGLIAIGATERTNILKEASKKLGTPSFDRDERNDQIDNAGTNFEDLDEKYYDLEDGFQEKLDKYIKDHRKEFYFEGVVTIPED